MGDKKIQNTKSWHFLNYYVLVPFHIFLFKFSYLHHRFQEQLKGCICGLKLQVTFAFLGLAEVWIFFLKVLVKTLCNHLVMIAFLCTN